MENQRQHIEVAEILATHKDQYFESQPGISPSQLKAYNAIVECRTEAMGGHRSTCDQCGYAQQSYNSCRNRHCPKCQFLKKERWVDAVMTRMPVDRSFHVVFTIPACLHRLFMLNQASAYDLLFKAAGKALSQCAQNPDFLGAQPGAVAILHTPAPLEI
jgi:predicted Zn-ribbon and HTH transcriptional regulator